MVAWSSPFLLRLHARSFRTLEELQEGHLSECHMWNECRGHSWRCVELQQLLECPKALGTLLHEGFEAPLLLKVQLVLSLVEGGEGLDGFG